MVVYAGSDGRRWNRPTRLADLIDIDPATRAALGDCLPNLRFLLDDLTTVDQSALRARNLTADTLLMMVLLATAPGNRHLAEELWPLSDDLRALWTAPTGKAELQCLIRYIFIVSETRESDLVPLIEQLGPEAREIIMTTADRLRAEGEAQGEARGRAELLIVQLSARFGELPAATVSRLRAADSGLLDVWAVRLLSAGSLAEVFGE
ncbi:hypothetical protein D7D52_16585 [Nocardia yunnanensis]|uniref:Uncharacterized protein n=2 Tax=Nocardia yunnanensis TaxID=2382165 RepID=A0A386ZDF0_9NOCA|nr:hypothetical protein D7D52_16585 [Nocardia yunnanensis]